MESQQSLPEELILHEILPRLPTKSILRFKCVSKTWLSLISQHSSLIAAKHTAGEKPVSIICGPYRTDISSIDRLFFGHNESNLVEIDTSYIYKKNPARVVLVGSCNGLVCLKLDYSDETHALILWNPATKEVNYLPTREVYSDESWLNGYTLGFDTRSGVHKVVWLIQSFSKEDNGLVRAQIFSKKSGRWRSLTSFTLMPATTVFLSEGYGLTIDGAIYWKGYPFNVLSFDLSTEEFREFDGPLSLSGLTDRGIMYMDNFHFELINWKGSMGFVFVIPGGAEIQVWLKNKDSNNSDSGWQKISTIQPSLGPISFGRVFSGQIIDISYRDNSDAKKQILYDLLTKEKRELGCLKKIWCLEFSEHFYTVISPN